MLKAAMLKAAMLEAKDFNPKSFIQNPKLLNRKIYFCKRSIARAVGGVTVIPFLFWVD